MTRIIPFEPFLLFTIHTTHHKNAQNNFPQIFFRTSKYLKKASVTRTCAIAGFFLSIPLFLIGTQQNIFYAQSKIFSAGIVLFTFLHFNETPAIVTSVVIGLGIVFCGGAVIHNVFIWKRVGILDSKFCAGFDRKTIHCSLLTCKL